jgi:hypothetical protein
MEEYRMERRIFEWNPMGKRSRGRPRNRWREEVLKDIRVQVVKNWTKVVMYRWAWHELVEKSKTHRGLQDERRRRNSNMLTNFLRYLIKVKFSYLHNNNVIALYCYSQT